MWVLQVSVLSLLLFNIWMEPLGEIICHPGVKYHHYADNTPKLLSGVIGVLSHCVEALGI